MSRTLRGPRGEEDRLVVGSTEQLHQLGPGNVEPLRHLRVHLGVGVHVLTGQRLEPLADSLGGDDEQWQHDERQQGQAPLEGEHCHQGRHQNHDVADHTAESAGDGVLGTDDVVVEATGQRPGLRTSEERDRHPLDLGEQRDAQVVDQPFADSSRTPALHDRERGVGDCSRNDDCRQHVDERSVLVGDGVVEDCPEGKWRNEFEEGADEDRQQEQEDDRPVWPCELPRPAHRAALQV